MAIRVLLVEDHAEFRAALAAWLRQRGFVVAEAGSVGEALAAEAADVAVLDLLLPGGSGLEVQQALLRRRPPAPSDTVRAGTLVLDPASREVSYQGAPVRLTRREFELLEVLARNAGVVLTRDQLLDRVWGYDFEVRTDAVDTFVSYLRRKLEADGRPRCVHTVRGVGFVLRPDAS